MGRRPLSSDAMVDSLADDQLRPFHISESNTIPVTLEPPSSRPMNASEPNDTVGPPEMPARPFHATESNNIAVGSEALSAPPFEVSEPNDTAVPPKIPPIRVSAVPKASTPHPPADVKMDGGIEPSEAPGFAMDHPSEPKVNDALGQLETTGMKMDGVVQSSETSEREKDSGVPASGTTEVTMTDGEEPLDAPQAKMDHGAEPSETSRAEIQQLVEPMETREAKASNTLEPLEPSDVQMGDGTEPLGPSGSVAGQSQAEDKPKVLVSAMEGTSQTHDASNIEKLEENKDSGDGEGDKKAAAKEFDPDDILFETRVVTMKLPSMEEMEQAEIDEREMNEETEDEKEEMEDEREDEEEDGDGDDEEKPALPGTEQSSESDDEDLGDFFDMEIAKAEKELSNLELAGSTVPMEVVGRYATFVHEALVKLMDEDEDVLEMLGPVPEGSGDIADEDIQRDILNGLEESDSAGMARTSIAGDVQYEDLALSMQPEPKVEEMDTDGSALPPAITIAMAPGSYDGDATMHDSEESAALAGITQANGLPLGVGRPLLLPPGYDHSATGVSTPSQIEEEEEEESEPEEIDLATLEKVREYMKTPPVDELPVYDGPRWFRDRKLLQAMEPSQSVSDFVFRQMSDDMTVKLREQEDAKRDYREKYEVYLRFTLSDDPAAVKSRDFFKSNKEPSEVVGKAPATEQPKVEGRRAGRNYGTELDLEQVLKESAREHQEKEEREARARKEKSRSDKEAVIPQMYWNEVERTRDVYVDTAGLLPVEKLVAAWQVLPPALNFTDEESELFEKAYLENPKQWGNIAKGVSTRDFKACIQFYYAMKSELNLKEKLKRQPRKRKKGRGKQRSSALVSELGNGENETEENQENGDNGERRRPRRAAAPTWGYDASAAADSDGPTPAVTPGRRGASSRNDSGTEKPDGAKKQRRTRATKDKEPKAPKPPQMLAPTPPGSKPNRSRSNSRAQAIDWASSQGPGDIGRLPGQFDMPQGGMQPPIIPMPQSLGSPERAFSAGSSMSEVMAPPSLRPEPPHVLAFDGGAERSRTPAQASSYWSVSETNDFPGLLRAFGTDWQAIANHMQTKTAVMVRSPRGISA